MRKFVPRGPTHRWLYGLLVGFGSILWAHACLTPRQGALPPPTLPPASSAAPDLPGEVSGYFAPSWGDSGSDGNGGVKLLVNDQKHLPLVKSDYAAKQKGDAATKQHPDWLLFFAPSGQSLALDFEWVTTADDKFYSNAWAGGGIAFNPSWTAVDASAARHLVLWAKASHKGVDITLALHSASKAKGKEATGTLSLARYGMGAELDGFWRKFVIPLADFPDLGQVDLSGLQQAMFNVAGGYPENQRVQVQFNNVYLTDSGSIAAITNPGYLLVPEGVLLTWGGDGRGIQSYQVRLGERTLETVGADVRRVVIPQSSLDGTRHRFEIVAVTARQTPSVKLDVKLESPETAKARVTLGTPRHAVSPYIFGANWGSLDALENQGITVRRWGGNRTTKYNWRQDVDSAGNDWYFLNDSGVAENTPEQDKRYYRFIAETLAIGAEVNFCLPISDWLAKAHPSGDRYCSFPTSLYPNQESTDGQGCGNGVTQAGQKIWGNDPARSMVKNSVQDQRAFVETVVELFGKASAGGVEFYSMDNEPGLWMHTHRDSMPRGVSAERLADLNIAYAKAVKAVDETAKVIGFGAWGVMELAGSSVDYTRPGPEGYKQESKHAGERYRERKQHGGDSQLVYLLKRFKQAEAETGKRLIDAIDIHWYPELYASDSQGRQQRVLADVAFDPQFAQAQWEALREWYDPAFRLGTRFESWTHGENASYLWDPYHPVLPALTGILERHYPGTRLAINEYDTGSRSHYHGALLRAAALGIFMQENLYMAHAWHETDTSEFLHFAHRLYSNYDGRGSKVLGRFVPSQSTSSQLLSYAVVDARQHQVVLINKDRERRIRAELVLPASVSEYRTYTLSESLGPRLLERSVHRTGKNVTLSVEPYSAMLIVSG